MHASLLPPITLVFRSFASLVARGVLELSRSPCTAGAYSRQGRERARVRLFHFYARFPPRPTPAAESPSFSPAAVSTVVRSVRITQRLCLFFLLSGLQLERLLGRSCSSSPCASSSSVVVVVVRGCTSRALRGQYGPPGAEGPSNYAKRIIATAMFQKSRDRPRARTAPRCASLSASPTLAHHFVPSFAAFCLACPRLIEFRLRFFLLLF